MKTLLYEIRYYLIATLLVIWLVPDHGKEPSVQAKSESVKPISTIRKNEIKYPAYLRVGPAGELDIEHTLLPEEKMKQDIRKNIDDLFPEPNHY